MGAHDGATRVAEHPLTGTNLRALPVNLEAEQALLGALLASGRALEQVEEFLRPAHFADPTHARIYDAICAMTAEGRRADAVSLVGRLGGELIEVDGQPVTPANYLASLLACMVGVVVASEYGRAVHDCWTRRELILAGVTLVDAAFSPPPGGGAAVLEAHDAALLAIAEGAGDTTPAVPIAQAVAETHELIKQASERETALAGISTGYAGLDRMTGGLQPRQLWLVGARPSMGKTALGLGIAVRAAACGANVLFWSGEMTEHELTRRLEAAATLLPTTALFTAHRWPDGAAPRPGECPPPISAQDWDRIVRAGSAAAKLPLVFDTRPSVTVAALRSRARKMKRAGKLDLLVVDYVGLLRARDRTDSRGLYERVTEISQDLKSLAASLDVPVVALAQLNRGNESREDKTPQLSDLRDSGALEQDSHVVMFLHRPHYYLLRAGAPTRRDKESEEQFFARVARWENARAAEEGRAIVSIAKNRNGPCGVVRLKFDDSTAWFRDDAEPPRGPAWL